MPQPPDLRSVAGDLRRDVALVGFLADESRSAELVLFASMVDSVDVVAGTAARLAIARHLAAHPGGSVSVVAPTQVAVAQRFLDLLGPLPTGVSFTTVPPLAERARFGLLPATLIPDAEAAQLAGEYTLRACEEARISEARSRLAALAVMEVADNALRHADPLELPPVAAATVSGRGRRIEVAVSDLGMGICDADAPIELLRAIPGAKGGTGFLPELLRIGARDGLDVSIEVLAGSARLRWNARSHRTDKRQYVPGTTVVVRIDPGPPSRTGSSPR